MKLHATSGEPQHADLRHDPASARRPSVFPFAAIVGQDDMKTALLIAAVDPKIGGVMVFGDRGTGKSTTVRALADLLPVQTVNEGCPYRCDLPDCEDCPALDERISLSTVLEPTPVVELPLGATEDRVLGALDLERALTSGEKRFEPGLLARAHGGFLYIDEINLLEDHIVDLLLDVSASGINVVEREGLSIRHPARFVLIGSGNPEEGELRPQLLDRFGLSVSVRSSNDVATRVEVVKRRLDFESDADDFRARWQAQANTIRNKIVTARDRLTETELPDEIVTLAATICVKLGTDGTRGELTLTRAARALAAYEASHTVTADHLRMVAPLALGHRMRRDPLDEAGSQTRITRALQDVFEI